MPLSLRHRDAANRNLVIGFYSDEVKARQGMRRLRADRFFRSALVSATANKRSVEGHPDIILLCASVVGVTILLASLVSRNPFTYSILLSLIGFVAAVFAARRAGLGLSRKILAEYASLALPGETMIAVECFPREARQLEELLQKGEAGKPAVFVIRPYLDEPWRRQRQRRELLSAQQLRSFATTCAGAHRIARPGKSGRSILHYLDRWATTIEGVRQDLARAVELNQSITPSAEWLLDNAYIIRRHIDDIRRNLPRRYHEFLPNLEGESGDVPLRILRLATDLSNKTDGGVSAAAIFNFISSYQGVSPLTTGELWAFPLMLRYVLIEDLAHQSLRVSRRQHDRERADFWANRLLGAAHRSPERIPLLFAQISASIPQLRPHFVIRLIGQLSEEETVFSAAQKWLEGKLDAPIQETIRAEHSRQTRKQVAISNDVTTLRRLAQLDWREIFESVSIVHAILEQDGVYASSDFETRDRCRGAVEEIARRSGTAEAEIAMKAVQLSSQADVARRRNVAYFLVDDGRPTLEHFFPSPLPVRTRLLRATFKHPLKIHLGSTALVFIALLGAGVWAAAASGAALWQLFGFALAAAFPAGEVSLQVVNYLASLAVPPRRLPRLSFESGIPDECRTMVVAPTMLLTRDSIQDEVERLEVRYLANPDDNLLFALLTDFSDALQQTTPEDEPLLERAMEGIRTLNARYGEGRFFLFHRSREWSDSEQRWIGWERKRGKLEDLNRFLNGAPRSGVGPLLRTGSETALEGIRFVITVDADTELPPRSAIRLIEAMAHPLNQAVLDPESGVVREGYGIIQPRVTSNLPSARSSLFARIFAESKGTDPYAQAISDVYQDLFGEGIYIGKAIYDVRAFHRALSGRFPCGRLLSHDLLEGNYLRVGFDSTIMLFEHFPSSYQAFAARQHRWIRGDWQLVEWLLPRTPNGRGEKERNPLPACGRWKILDNLRRTLVAPASLLTLVGSWLMFPDQWFWNLFIAAALLAPAVISLPARVRQGAQGGLLVWREQGIELLRSAIAAALIPYQAWMSTDAIVRVWHRKLRSHRDLLEWETAQSTHRRLQRDSGESDWRSLIVCLGAAALTALLAYRGFVVWPAATPYLMLWLVSPAVLHKINAAPAVGRIPALNEDDRLYVRQVARETWRYFDDFVGEPSRWLPPDNSQESIKVEVAYRTSPTNIGLWLLSVLAAHDFGYLTLDQLIARVSATFDTIDLLEKHRGHLLNWYDIKTLEPLRPRYVSTVDSGNLLACLWTLDRGLQDAVSSPFAGLDCLDGIADALGALDARWHDRRTIPAAIKRAFSDLGQLCRSRCRGAGEFWNRIHSVADICTRLTQDFHDQNLTDTREIAYWIDQVNQGARNRVALMNRYFGWMPLLLYMSRQMQQSIEFNTLVRRLLEEAPLSLEALAGVKDNPLRRLEAELEEIDHASPEWVRRFRDEVARARACAQEALAGVRTIVERSRRLEKGTDLAFLYDKDRKLFAIGHDLSETPQPPSHYDLLASEARLTSLIAVARGEVDPKHWQALGRPFGIFAGRKVLYSWSGSMFEYLMPLLCSRAFDDSLLDHACREAVATQIEYGRSRRVPWGISESAFSALDSNQIYQYRAFGVPFLGLKRGLADDLVVAPYATALAMMMAPAAAVENLRRLEAAGARGDKGFYEAIDYSRESREGKRGAIVYAHMAHHQGMSFVAMDNALHGDVMQRRFHADPRVRAVEPLLYEGIPPFRISSSLNAAEERRPARLVATPVESVSGRFSDEKTLTPKIELLSNGSYSLMITNSGGGYSRWRDYDITRWRADTTRDEWGSYCYVRDLQNGAFWSTTYHPTDRPHAGYSVAYYADRVEFRHTVNGIESLTEVALSPEDDVEIRRITLINRSAEKRTLDITTYAELALATHAADRAHPAFSKMFVHTEFLPDKAALLAFRRSSEDRTPRIWVGHLLAAELRGRVEYETSRPAFIGRGRNLASPVALTNERALTGAYGAVLDPIFSIRREVTLAPGEKARFSAVTLAAESREGAERLIDKYSDLAAADRTFELAWTHAQLSFRYLRIDHEDAQRFQELAGRMIYPDPGLRLSSERLGRNALGQSRLWAFGISGDLPICALVVSDPLDLGTVREMLQAHSFWYGRGFTSDLVILNAEAGGYELPLQQKLLKLIQIHSVETGVDRPGGVFLRQTEQMAADDFNLILSAARVVIFASRGSLNRQLSGHPDITYPPALRPMLPPTEEPARRRAIPSLSYFNGTGGFTADGREYVICLNQGEETPAPWINVLANPSFGALVDEKGQGTVWNVNSQMNRLIPWRNDPVTGDSSSSVYVRDEETGEFWRPSSGPSSRIHHGQGYTRLEHASHGIDHVLTLFVPVNDQGGEPLLVQRLELLNRSARKRRLTVTFYAEWVLGQHREDTQVHVAGSWDPVSWSLLARNPYNTEFSNYIGFATVRPAAATYTADRLEFLGRNGSIENPAALGRQSLSGRTGAGLDPCAALQVRLEIEPGQSSVVAFMLGEATSIQEVRAIVDRYSEIRSVNDSLIATKNWWERTLGAIQVHTPEKSVDFLLNRWLLYQTLGCRIWGRTALYQSGGAFGFRDQLQDVLALVYSKPELAREHILRAAARQFVEGDVQHWWHPQSGAGIRTRCSDDLLWLPYAAAQYVQVTGDRKILDERVPFLEGRPLADHELEVYSTPASSMADGTLFEHCRRAVERGCSAGEHGLPLIGLCDWNDGFNRVGAGGKGESVWLGWFLIETLKSFAKICFWTNQNSQAQLCLARIRRLEAAIEEQGWDGEWYRRAYFDDGAPLGSYRNAECFIDSLAQSWAAISGSAPEERVRRALDGVERHLIRDPERLILLFTPPFQKSEQNPGYVMAYPPGVRENGGQYTHAAVWVAMAFARQGNGGRAVELLRMLNPIELTRSPSDAARYRCEPYVLAGDVYSLEGHVGQGGWSWYTGSSAWMYRVWIEEVLGLKVAGESFTLTPSIPAEWPGFSMTYRYGGTRYRITVDNPERTGRGVAWVYLDGERIPTAAIPLRDDGRDHEVQVQLGSGPPVQLWDPASRKLTY